MSQMIEIVNCRKVAEVKEWSRGGVKMVEKELR